jgi:hypothetical protein
MPITELYSDYFQKSKTFLLPAIGIRRSIHTSHMMTFITWPGKYAITDCRLTVCKADGVDEWDYRKWEKIFIFNNPYFESVEWADQKTIVYTFNLEQFKNDWDLFLEGRYSKMSPVIKERIKCYYGETSGEWDYVKSFLYPERYFDKYAELMYDEKDRAEGAKVLRSVGELCPKYDPVNETLTFTEADLVK